MIKTPQVENILVSCDGTKYVHSEALGGGHARVPFPPTAKYKGKAATVPDRSLPSRKTYSWRRSTKHTGKQQEITEESKKQESYPQLAIFELNHYLEKAAIKRIIFQPKCAERELTVLAVCVHRLNLLNPRPVLSTVLLLLLAWGCHPWGPASGLRKCPCGLGDVPGETWRSQVRLGGPWMVPGKQIVFY